MANMMGEQEAQQRHEPARDCLIPRYQLVAYDEEKGVGWMLPGCYLGHKKGLFALMFESMEKQ